MKRLFVLMILTTIISSCAQEGGADFTRKDALQTLAFKANLLSLSAEDIQMLSLHTPKILGKIMKGTVVTLEEIIKMNEIGLSPESLVLIIDHTKSKFNLNTSDVIRLQMECVPFKVINYLIKT